MALNYEPCSSGCGLSGYFPNKVELIPHQSNGCRLFVIFGEQGMGLLPATRGIGSNRTRWGLLKHLLPLYPAPAAWRLSQLAPRITKNDDDPGYLDEGCEALSCSKQLANHSGATKLFICHDTLTRAAA